MKSAAEKLKCVTYLYIIFFFAYNAISSIIDIYISPPFIPISTCIPKRMNLNNALAALGRRLPYKSWFINPRVATRVGVKHSLFACTEAFIRVNNTVVPHNRCSINFMPDVVVEGVFRSTLFVIGNPSTSNGGRSSNSCKRERSSRQQRRSHTQPLMASLS